MQRSSAFSLIPLRDEFKICSLNQETENSFVYSSECFSIVLVLFRVKDLRVGVGVGVGVRVRVRVTVPSKRVKIYNR